MTNEQLKEGQELLKLIETTEAALSALGEYMPEDRKKEKIHDDKMYWLCISEHKDGSGKKVDLKRYWGNKRLMDVVKYELEVQLNELKEKFDTL